MCKVTIKDFGNNTECEIEDLKTALKTLYTDKHVSLQYKSVASKIKKVIFISVDKRGAATDTHSGEMINFDHLEELISPCRFNDAH
jgi:hypothetical protein